MNNLERIEDSFKQFRLSLLRPLLFLATKAGIHPWIISSLGLLAAVFMFFFLIKQDFGSAFVALTINIILDGIDGSLARYQKKDSDKGKFFDMVVDNLSATLLILALMAISAVDVLSGAIFIYLMSSTIILAVIINHLKFKSDWFFHARAGFLTQLPKNVFFFLFMLWALGIVNVLNTALVIMNIYLFLLGFVNFIRVQYLKRKRRRYTY